LGPLTRCEADWQPSIKGSRNNSSKKALNARLYLFHYSTPKFFFLEKRSIRLILHQQD
jgi:hypothetical protein